MPDNNLVDPGELAGLVQPIERRVGHLPGVDLEMAPKIGAGVGAAEAIGAQHQILILRDELADLIVRIFLPGAPADA